MTNPFTNTGTNAFDIPMPAAVREAQSGQGGQVQNALVYDPIGKTCSPNLNALLEEMHANRNAQLRDFVNGITAAVAGELEPMRERIAELESALSVERQKVSAAIRYAAAGFLDEPTAPDNLDDLDKRHAEHKKFMKGVGK